MTIELTSERLAELIDEARQIARAEPQHEWDGRALEWPLTSESVVVEVGGYKGRWSLQIAERYNPMVYVFEPQLWAYMVLCGVLDGYNGHILPYGLGVEDARCPMGSVGTDGGSLLTAAKYDDTVAVFEIERKFRGLGIENIDLMLMNIEGYEYTLLPHMLDKGILPDRLMVQFHAFADPDGSKLKAIKRRLKKHYTVAWEYGITLIAWQKKGL